MAETQTEGWDFLKQFQQNTGTNRKKNAEDKTQRGWRRGTWQAVTGHVAAGVTWQAVMGLALPFTVFHKGFPAHRGRQVSAGGVMTRLSRTR